MTKKILTLVFFVLIPFSFSFKITSAAVIDATGMLGHYDNNGNPQYDAIALPNNAQGFATPASSCVDTANHFIFVADSGGNRVLVFGLTSSNVLSTTTASYVLGFTNFTDTPPGGLSQSLVHNPYGLACDPANNRVFVSDRTNNRVLVFNTASTTIANGESADYVLGQSNFSSGSSANTQGGLSAPHGLSYDSVSSRLFVADSGNNRVVVFDVSTSTISNGELASNVLGQTLFTTRTTAVSATGMNTPYGLSYEASSTRLFVADTFNSRVTVFNVATSTISNGASAAYVLGQVDANSNDSSATTATSMGNPEGVISDPVNNRVFVADSTYNRVTVYNSATSTIATGETALNVLGQTNFTASSRGTTQSKIDGSVGFLGLDYDPANNALYVADAGNNRIMVFTTTSVITNGQNATYEIGHADTTTGNPVYTAYDTYNNPRPQSAYNIHGSVIDTKNHRMFISDYSDATPGARVLVYNLDSNNNINTSTPSYVLGWTDFYTAKSIAFTQSGFNKIVMIGPAYDSVNERLFVSDTSNNRVLVFNVNPSSIANGENATAVLGQTNFTNHSGATTQAGLRAPSYLNYDSATSRLFVADSGNNRVMVFNATSTITNGQAAINVLGQSSFTVSTAALTSSGMNSPWAVTYDATSSRLFVADRGNNRVLVFDAGTSTISDGKTASNVLGQSSFTTNSSALSQSGLNNPKGVIYDYKHDLLFVGDYGNNRVMMFDVSTSTIANGENARNLIGQSTFTSSDNNSFSIHGSGGSEQGTYNPANNTFFDAQYYPDRVMQFPLVLINSTSVPNGNVGSSYSSSISATQNQGTLSYSIASGSLPSGLTLSTAGAITGIPTTYGTSTFTVEADDTFSSGSFPDQRSFSLFIDNAIPDTVAPVISSIATSTTQTSAIVTFLTDEVASSTISYGPSTTYTNTSSVHSFSTSTSITITGLSPATTYHFQILASDASLNLSNSTDLVFVTRNKTHQLTGYQPIVPVADTAPALPLLPVEATSSPIIFSFSRDLFSGSSGDDVRQLEKFLNSNGFFVAASGPGSPGKEKNTFDSATKAALIKFQIANGIVPAVGYFGFITRAVIAGKSRTVSLPVAVTPQIQRDLTVGSSGPDVVALQNVLVSKGYLSIPNGIYFGYFGTLTKEALARFQAAHAIFPAVGYYGAVTRAFVQTTSNTEY